MPFKISKKYINTDWSNLSLKGDSDLNWTNAIPIIKDRFESRFFNQIDKIASDEFSGFIVMSIDCLLIETLMQFYLGVDNTEINYRGNHWRAFRDFFHQSSYFNTIFNSDDICETFYKQFRCGLLHQAQTKEKSLIKIYQENMVSFSDIADVKFGLIIDRIQFHQNLILEFEDYIDKLSTNKNNFQGQNLRMKAINKMKLICSE